MARKVVLVACGTGIATSTVVSEAVGKIAKENKLDVEVVQCKITEVPGYVERASLLVTTTIVKQEYPFPIINARAFLTGIGLDAVKAQILEELKK